MFEVQEIELTLCNQSQGKLHISHLFEGKTHTVKQDWRNNSLWLEAKLGLGSIYNWRRKRNYTKM